MENFFRDATSNQLLTLMLFPTVGAILLIGFLVFYSIRGRKKSRMKLGFEISDESADDKSAGDQQLSSVPDGGKRISPEKPSVEQPPAGEDTLNLDILGAAVDSEVPDMSTSSPIDEKPQQVDIADRLGGQQPVPASAASAAAPATEVTSVPNPDAEADAVELMRFLRHPQTGRLIVEVAGQRYNKLTDITDREVGQYILELAAHFLAFTNGVVATEAGVKSVYLPNVAQTPEPLVKFTPVTQLPDPDSFIPAEQEKPKPSEPLVPPPSPEAEAAFLASLQANPPAQPLEPAPPQRRGFFGAPKSSKETLMPSFDLVGEINTIVQARLMVSPLAATTELEILSDHSGGIRIKVNGEIYGSPDDIPDPDVKALIKNSIKQWERS